jgi:hypothetical protein
MMTRWKISITLPVQPGLSYEVCLCLQNGDELGFSVDRHFHIEFFPCTKPDRAKKYLDAGTGFLSGQYRILEHFRGTTCYRLSGHPKPANEGHLKTGQRE